MKELEHICQDMEQEDQNISQEVQQNDQNIIPGSETKRSKLYKARMYMCSKKDQNIGKNSKRKILKKYRESMINYTN